VHSGKAKQNCSINRYTIKREVKASKNLFSFWFSTFRLNKCDMKFSSMQLSGLHDILKMVQDRNIITTKH